MTRKEPRPKLVTAAGVTTLVLAVLAAATLVAGLVGFVVWVWTLVL